MANGITPYLHKQCRLYFLDSPKRENRRRNSWSKVLVGTSRRFLHYGISGTRDANSDVLDAKRKAVKKIGWNLLLKDESLVWSYKKPYDVLLKPQYRSDLRRAQDLNLQVLTDAAFRKRCISRSANPPV